MGIARLFLSARLFDNINHRRQVVAITVKPRAASVSTHHVALVFPLLLEEVVTAENLVA